MKQGMQIHDLSLTNFHLDKMATILADGIFKCICLNENN